METFEFQNARVTGRVVGGDGRSVSRNRGDFEDVCTLKEPPKNS
jgi:hypothetical protein